MAFSAQCGQRSLPSLLRQRCVSTPELRHASSLRAFSTRIPARGLYSRPQLQKSVPWRAHRNLSVSPRCLAAIQEAPSAKSYLASGAIQGAGELVDVKKVLVIGSGGLSIGQAGEFDYSGMYRYFNRYSATEFIYYHVSEISFVSRRHSLYTQNIRARFLRNR